MKEEKNISSDNVWNTDQSDFNYEMASRQTLSHRGERDTHGLVQPMKAMTHSYTLQVLISNAGKLAPKSFSCLEKTNRTSGPSVKQQIEANTPQNCVITCTKSGEISKSSLIYWIKSCLDEVVTCNTLLLQDSWGPKRTSLSLKSV